MNADLAAAIFGGFLGVVVAFQIALALGAPWGHLAMGGKFPGRFPGPMRLAALVQALLLTCFGVVVFAKVGWIDWGLAGVSHWAIWVVVVVSALSFGMNLITPSRGERLLWAPTGLILFLSSLAVALAA